MSILVFLEHHGDDFEKGSLGVLSKAASLGGDVAAVLAGGGPTAALASEAGKFGAATVYVADDESLDPPLPQPRVDVVQAVISAGGYDTVLFSNSVLAADVAAGLRRAWMPASTGTWSTSAGRTETVMVTGS